MHPRMVLIAEFHATIELFEGQFAERHEGERLIATLDLINRGELQLAAEIFAENIHDFQIEVTHDVRQKLQEIFKAVNVPEIYRKMLL